MSEVWFKNGQKSLTVLTSGNRCFVMFSEDELDKCLYAQGEDVNNQENYVITFKLENGEENQFLYSETIEASVAIQLIKCFVEEGKPSELVTWRL